MQQRRSNQDLIDDGLCIIQPLLMRGAQYARASDMQVAGGAMRLIQECQVDGVLQGGLAYNIGECLYDSGALI